MPVIINEWEFTADVGGWINEILAKHPHLPFLRAKCEQRGAQSLKRRDLTLLDSNQVIVLTGEVKLPFQKDGGSPYIESVVQDARQKAQRAGVSFFFTWNVNTFVLWETFSPQTAPKDRQYKAWEVTKVFKPEHLSLPATVHSLKTWLLDFLREFADIQRGAAALGVKLPDEKFIEMLESSLSTPIALTFAELEERYQQPHFKEELSRWMRGEQGWLIYDDPEGIRDNLERSAKFSCYTLVNKLVFFEALLKRYRGQLTKIVIPDHISQGDTLRLHLEKHFAEAKDVTKDYETVFGEEHISIGNRLPFYSDAAVPHWRSLINEIHDFDFSLLDYDVIGSVFERLIAPEERHKFGQFYTRPEVVDLINSFCIRRGDEKVMDPACGGGTFLVRAYVRKRELAPARKHGQLLDDLFGVDISHFATHLSTINLATRDLIDADNYPQIARSDFFNLKTHNPFVTLPVKLKVKGLGKLQHRHAEIPPLDAVVGNPPYIRQEEIPRAKDKKTPEPGTKEFYQVLVEQEAGAELSGRSDIHCYFWPHAATFLKEDGWLCLLTSSQWLDVEYGFKLQRWLLDHFAIAAVFESLVEPWFVGARVATAVTILRRQPDDDARRDNVVRFVQLRRPLREILIHDGTSAGAVMAVDVFRDEILSLTGNTVNARYRARLVRQGDLREEGIRLGRIMSKTLPENGENDLKQGEYYGGKWGVYLRAPDLWFELLDEFSSGFVPLGEIAEVRFGVKSGKDCFFFPKDCSTDCLAQCQDPRDFKDRFGVSRKKVASGKVKLVRCGEGRGEIKPIEAKYLEPEIHSLMEVSGFSVSPQDCSRLILLVSKKKSQLRNQHVLDYIRWGEKQDFHTGPTCYSRTKEGRYWYDLTGHRRGILFWPMSQQYKHAIPINEHNILCNANLYDVILQEHIDPTVIAGILNSSLVVLSKFQYGRPVGVEGNYKTQVVDANIMLIPNPFKGSKKLLSRISLIFLKMKERPALQFLSERRLREMAYRQKGREADLEQLSDLCELDMPDRRELDGAVLEMLGVADPDRRQALIDELYAYLRQFFEWTRQKEEKAILNKLAARRKVKVNPQTMASQILTEIQNDYPLLLRRYEPDFLDVSKPYDVFDLPAEGHPAPLRDLYHDSAVVFMKGAKKIGLVPVAIPEHVPFVVLLAENNVRGLVRVPHAGEECERVGNAFQEFLYQREAVLRELIAKRTVDEDLQEKIYESLQKLLLNPHIDPQSKRY
ncbi:HsdM family class I SAM-dependent methyltransferase [Desulfobacca acetoxidans]|uniref:N-6 DNA methylase n=1 Tax=Desulfobacca acetoxidans (strain ATCC 700848 / DSM 11109 / ASRB2) TaxID=880072 RepID=F2NHQ3_DESAR|nr:N-6 DNA methylase [Desulfobacca acetoxidans]AEB09240.1 N-6 DNA methylase [Desulfobacca acetoxidans DSM 11109]